MIWGKNIGFFDMAVKDGEGWFINVYYGAVYRLNLTDYSLKLETMLEPRYREPYLFANVAFCGDVLIAAPRGGNAILLYDTARQKVSTIRIDEKYIPEGNRHNLIMGIEIFDGTAVLFPGTCRAILVLDIPDGNITYIDYSNTRLGTYNGNSVMFRHIRRIDDRTCLLPTFQHRMVFEFDLMRREGRYLRVDGAADCFVDILPFDGKYILSMRRSKRLMLWDKESGKTEQFALCGESEGGNGIRDILFGDGYLYCVDTSGDRIYVIDTASRSCIKTIWIQNPYLKNDIDMPQRLIMACKDINADEVLLSLCSPETFMILDKRTGSVEKREINADGKSFDRITDMLWESRRSEIEHEKNAGDLREFLRANIRR